MKALEAGTRVGRNTAFRAGAQALSALVNVAGMLLLGRHLSASGYGEFHPVASNKSSTGRARNRRIEILLTPSLDPKHIAKSKLRAEAQPVEKPEKAEKAAAEPRHKKK